MKIFKGNVDDRTFIQMLWYNPRVFCNVEMDEVMKERIDALLLLGKYILIYMNKSEKECLEMFREYDEVDEVTIVCKGDAA